MPTLSPYVPFDWKGGDEITASQLDHLEQGVAAVTDAVNNLDFDAINNLDFDADIPTRVSDLLNDAGFITNDDLSNFDVRTGKTLIPIYLGDYICPSNYCPSSSIKINNNFYAFDCQVRQKNNGVHVAPTNNEGVIRKFDLTSNSEVIAERQSNAIIGHANSVAFDGTYVYIVPEWSYTVVDDTPTETPVKILYKYNNQMEYVGTEEIPTDSDSLIGVSYDSKNDKLYCYTWNRKIYIKEDNNWTYYSTIDMTNIKVSDITYDCEAANGTARSYNQDFAVYDGKFYLSSPSAVIISGVITEGTTYATEDYIVSHADIQYRFNLGELEGFEFDNKGHLYATMYSGLYDGNNGFIVELPIGVCMVNAPSTVQYDFDEGTLTLTPEYQTAFWLESYRIRSINQLEIRLMRYNSSQIQIPQGSSVIEDYHIRTNDKIRLDIEGSLEVKSIQVCNGCLNLATDRPDDGTPRLTITGGDYPITVTRSGELKITGQSPLRIDLKGRSKNSNRELIHVGYAYSQVSIREKPIWHDSSYSFTIGGTRIQQYSYYLASGNAFSVPQAYFATYVSPPSGEDAFVHQNNVQGGWQIWKISGYLSIYQFRICPLHDWPAQSSQIVGTVPFTPVNNIQQTFYDYYGNMFDIIIGTDKKITLRTHDTIVPAVNNSDYEKYIYIMLPVVTSSW